MHTFNSRSSIWFVSVFTVISLIFSTVSHSQQFKHETYGGTFQDRFLSMRANRSGDKFFVVGDTLGGADRSFDGIVYAINDDLKVAWEKSIGGANFDVFLDVDLLPDNGAIIAGHTRSHGAGDQQGWVVRIAADGAVLWEKTFGGAGKDQFASVRALPDGGALLAGTTESGGTGAGDGWIVRIGPDGAMLWQKTLGGAQNDKVSDLEILPDGGAVFAGFKTQGVRGYEGWVFRLDAGGNLLWEKTFGGAREDLLFRVTLGTSGDVYASGASKSGGAGPWAGWVMRLGLDGSAIWDRRLAGPTGQLVLAATAHRDGGVILAGLAERNGSRESEGWIIHVDEAGASVGEKKISSRLLASFLDIAQLADGTLFLVGHTGFATIPTRDGWVVHTNAPR